MLSNLILYDRINRDALVRLRLAYVEPDVVLDAPLEREEIDDMGMTPRYDS